jgi:hypothetical protein
MLVTKIYFKIAEVPKNYTAFVDKIDGYSYYYPSDWRVSYLTSSLEVHHHEKKKIFLILGCY